MFIYESHMGGWFTSDDELDYDSLYCEECGDSDNLIGEVNTKEEAWDLLKDETSCFDDSICDKCSHNGDYEYCDNECEDYMHSGGYDYLYVMNFLQEIFPSDKGNIYSILVSKHIGCEDKLFVNVKPNGYKFGEAIEFPIGICLDEDGSKLIANSYVFYLDSFVEGSLKKKAKKEINGNTYILYTCKSNEKDDSNWKEGCHYCEDGWWGYIDIEKIDELVLDKDIWKFIKENI